jgi:hypothetical protein
MTQYNIGRDRNGNKVCRVKPRNGRAFSIQTNGNLPHTDRHGVGEWTEAERRTAEACGFVPIDLGKHVLRSETAALHVLSAAGHQLHGGVGGMQRTGGPPVPTVGGQR